MAYVSIELKKQLFRILDRAESGMRRTGYFNEVDHSPTPEDVQKFHHGKGQKFDQCFQHLPLLLGVAGLRKVPYRLQQADRRRVSPEVVEQCRRSRLHCLQVRFLVSREAVRFIEVFPDLSGTSQHQVRQGQPLREAPW
jgi:hypothetical protein